jgi:hypothetical protein
LDGKEHDPSCFTPPVEIFLKTATGKEFWKWFGSHGALEALTLADMEETANGRLLRYDVTLAETDFR